MADLSEQRATVKGCLLLGKDYAQTFVTLWKAYKYDDMGKIQVS